MAKTETVIGKEYTMGVDLAKGKDITVQSRLKGDGTYEHISTSNLNNMCNLSNIQGNR